MHKVDVVVGGSVIDKVVSEVPIREVLGIPRERAKVIVELVEAALRQNETWQEAYDEIDLMFNENERDYALIVLGTYTKLEKEKEVRKDGRDEKE